MPFERAIEELESIVKRLEEGKVPLEESVAIYERGEALKRRCEELLRQAEARVEKITLDAGQADRHRAAGRRIEFSEFARTQFAKPRPGTALAPPSGSHSGRDSMSEPTHNRIFIWDYNHN